MVCCVYSISPNYYFGLVCFKENEFLPCLATLEKSSQRKLNSSQQKYTLLSKESVFLRIKKGKHFPFHKSRSLSCQKRLEAATITDAFSGQLKHLACTISGMFFFSISFMFYNLLCRSVKNMAFHFHKSFTCLCFP